MGVTHLEQWDSRQVTLKTNVLGTINAYETWMGPVYETVEAPPELRK